MNTEKMLIVGVDGASLELVNKWRGELPNISDLMDGGASGELESTMPPVTLPAWASFATGKRPESLGFFGFQKVQFNPRRTTFVQSGDWTPAIWDILSQNGLRVGVINFPGTYPPRKVNGFMISGFLSPSSTNIFYPVSFRRVVHRITSRYRIYPDVNPYVSSEEKYITNVYEIFEERLNVAEYCLRKFDWDLFVVVFMVLDWVQHYFWKHMDPDHPLHQPDSPYHDTIKESYMLVDSAIGRLLKLAGGDTDVMIASDHGFGPLHGSFFVNSWLNRKGYLRWKRNFVRMALSDIFKNRMVNRLARKLTLNVGAIPDRIKYRKVFEKILQDDSLDDPFTQSISNIDVDWGKTKAFGFGYYNEIYINLQERGGCVKSGEYLRLVEDIVRELGDLCEGLGFELRAFTSEKPGKSGSPDVMYLINDGEYVQSNRFGSSRLWELSVGKSGDHRLYGMWVLKGPRVKQVNGRQAGIWDLAPTIYHLYGVKAPPGIDGMCLKDVMRPSIRENV